MRLFKPAITVVLFTLCVSTALAQAPDSLSFQGFVTNASGLPLDTSSIDMTFKLYRGGIPVWEEMHAGVAVEDGVFNVLLGGTTPLDTMAFNTPLELGITVGGDPEISPRTPLAAAPYAKALPGLYTFFEDNSSAEGYNVIGGGPNNLVGAGVLGATIGGGGGINLVGTPVPNTVLGNWGTVAGGLQNTAGGSRSTVGGGTSNTASGIRSTVAGGQDNSATGDWSTIGGGQDNRASTNYATVGGGLRNKASGLWSAIGSGEDNTASGTWSMVPGGQENSARGAASLAAGYAAKAIHYGTFVWNDRSVIGTTNDSLVSTASNQFLIRAAGGVGIGTNAPDEQLHILESGGSTAIKLGGNGTAGPNGIVFDDDASGDGVSLFYRTGPNQLILERASSGTGTDADDAFIYDRGNEDFSLIRHTEAERHQLELRNTGGITIPNFGGIVFTQGSSGGTTLADLRVHYHNNGLTDVSLGNRGYPQLLFLEDDGQIGIGTTTPSEKLEVNGNVLANNVGVPSDRRLKRNVEPLGDALALAKRLQGISYEWRTNEYPDRGFEAGRHLGFVAQDVEQVLPEVVRQRSDGSYTVSYQEVIPVLLEAIKELSEKVKAGRERYSEQQALLEDQQALIDDQRSLIADLSSKVAEIERRLAL